MIAQDTQDSELAGRIGAHLTEILEHVSELGEARAERARRAFVHKAIEIGLAGLAGLVLVCVTLFATWQLARGLAQGLGELTGRAWLGELLSGALLLLLVIGAAALALRRAGPRNLKIKESLEIREKQAWHGLQRATTELGEELVSAGKLRERVREHPYVSLGAGLATGLAAAPLLQGLLKHLGPLVRLGLSGVPGLAPILRREHGPKSPTNNGH